MNKKHATAYQELSYSRFSWPQHINSSTKEPEGTQTDLPTQTARTAFVSQVTQVKWIGSENILYSIAWNQPD